MVSAAIIPYFELHAYMIIEQPPDPHHVRRHIVTTKYTNDSQLYRFAFTTQEKILQPTDADLGQVVWLEAAPVRITDHTVAPHRPYYAHIIHPPSSTVPGKPSHP
jgi:hypothetical protein